MSQRIIEVSSSKKWEHFSSIWGSFLLSQISTHSQSWYKLPMETERAQKRFCYKCCFCNIISFFFGGQAPDSAKKLSLGKSRFPTKFKERFLLFFRDTTLPMKRTKTYQNRTERIKITTIGSKKRKEKRSCFVKNYEHFILFRMNKKINGKRP